MGKRQWLLKLLDLCFKWASDDKSYLELEVENYQLRLLVERLTGASDYWYERQAWKK